MRTLTPIVLLALLLTACGTTGVAVPPTALPAASVTAQPAWTATPTVALPSLTPATTPPPTVVPTEVSVAPTDRPDRSAQTPQPTPAARPLPTRIVATPAPAVTGEAPAALLDRILADVVQRSGANRQEVVIVRDEAVVWPDGSLGCPEPGVAYLQVLTDGYWVVAQVGDTRYDYRVDADGRFRLCTAP